LPAIVRYLTIANRIGQDRRALRHEILKAFLGTDLTVIAALLQNPESKPM
jgi:hypothetical protein